MLEKFSKISPNVGSILLYGSSASLDYIIMNMIKAKFGTTQLSTIEVKTVKGLRQAFGDTIVLPVDTDKWLVVVEMSRELSFERCKPFMLTLNPNRIAVFKTSFYGDWVRAKDDKEISSVASAYVKLFAVTRLEAMDVTYLHDKVYALVEDTALSAPLMAWVKKYYLYDPQAVCNLFSALRSGAICRNKRDVIYEVGLGSNNVDYFVTRILTSRVSTHKDIKRSLKMSVETLNYLSMKHSHDTIRIYMVNSLRGIMDIKEMQSLGIYTAHYKRVPESVDAKRLNRLRRFERTILESISLSDVVLLLHNIRKYQSNSFDDELLLLQALYGYFGELSLRLPPEEFEESAKK